MQWDNSTLRKSNKSRSDLSTQYVQDGMLDWLNPFGPMEIRIGSPTR